MNNPPVFYLDEPVQNVGEQLTEQLGSLYALSAILNNWISDIRHADAKLLTGMAALIRLQGREIARLADDLDAVLRQKQQMGGVR